MVKVILDKIKEKIKKFKFRTTCKKVMILHYQRKTPPFIIKLPFGLKPVIKEER